MITKVQKWGNSHGLRLTKQVMTDADIDTGDDVHIEVRDGAIIISPVRRVRGRYDLSDLVKGLTPDDRPVDTGWGDPVGREEW